MAFDPYAPGATMRLDRTGGRPAAQSPIGELAVKLSWPKSEGGQGLSLREAAAAAKAAAKRFAPEHPAWARALEEWPATAAKRVLDALAEGEAARKWVDENVHGLGGRRLRLPEDQLLDAGIAKLEAANEQAGDALARLLVT
jgi:hypothetical protein